jgi:hypothetical protein
MSAAHIGSERDYCNYEDKKKTKKSVGRVMSTRYNVLTKRIRRVVFNH